VALELELYQSQVGSGPCLESIATGAPISVSSAAEIGERWPVFATALAAAGYRSAHCYPMTWQGQLIGGLNIFRKMPEPLASEQSLLAQTFADIATVAIIHSGHTAADVALARTRSALAARNVIEQAKGVLAYQRQLDMAAAYAQLQAQAESSGRSLSDTADTIMRSARRR
jgi:GAF domain-containing protein